MKKILRIVVIVIGIIFLVWSLPGMIWGLFDYMFEGGPANNTAMYITSIVISLYIYKGLNILFKKEE